MLRFRIFFKDKFNRVRWKELLSKTAEEAAFESVQFCTINNYEFIRIKPFLKHW